MSDQTFAEARRVQRAIDEVGQDQDETLEPDPSPDRTRRFSSLGFSRMRTRWTTGEEGVIDTAKAQAERELAVEFADIYRILNKLYILVREVARDHQTGEVLTDSDGFAVWARDDSGMIVEDWSRLTDRDKESFLHQITTRLVIWEQKAADFKGEALFAKAAWEERFALSFVDAPAPDGTKKPTEADRTQYAQAEAREQRYLAIYMTVRSNKAEALVRSMDRLAMRLNNTLR